ncbi:MAG: exodeoxyribonuclease III [Gammaproteobacteria bacterium]|nr:exodeoxyribonuclease III [Gammaproteobacteria bacterium]MDH3467052.1 exodeoxyribonuclease III [Gammaproteobacteria bacterium]
MKIVSFNANGIRSASSKGFFDWMRHHQPDVVCIQEIKAWEEQLEAPEFHPRGYHRYIHAAEKKGYSGVAVYCRERPEQIKVGLDWPQFDREGRYLRIDYKRISIASVYIPSGTSGDLRQAFKFEVLDGLKPILQRMRRQRRQHILCGDWNIAHREIDLKNWRSNRKNSGFLPEERAWLDWLYEEAGFVDVFRRLDPRPEQYTWWSNRGQARANNIGWRLDLQVATPGTASKARTASIYTAKRFSDHAPIAIDYDMTCSG